MKKLKSILALALTGCLLTAGAMLPVMVGTIQNRNAAEPGMGELRSVDLRLEEPLTLVEKLAVLARGSHYPISRDMELTKDQLLEFVESGLGPYYDRELVPYNWKEVSIQTAPYIVYREDAPAMNYGIWFVELEGSHWKAEMAVDDETGKILAMEFSVYSEQDVYTGKDYAGQVKTAWFESVGLSEGQWNEKKLSFEGNAAAVRSYYSDKETGSVTMEFTADSSGFRILAIEAESF